MYLKDKSKLIVVTEDKPYPFWKTKALINYVDGYEVLVFIDSRGSTGVCLRKEEDKFKKDFFNIGEFDQHFRGDPRMAEQFNKLKWHLAPIKIIMGYEDWGFAKLWTEERYKFDNAEDLVKRLPGIISWVKKLDKITFKNYTTQLGRPIIFRPYL